MQERELTVVQFMSHELSSAIVKDHSQRGAVGLHVPVGPVVPLESNQFDQSSHVQQAIDGQSSLFNKHKQTDTQYITMLHISSNMPPV